MPAEEQVVASYICPHCGFESDDWEICKACGRWIEEPPLGRNISIKASLVDGVGSWFRDAILHPDRKISEIGPIVNPSTGLPIKGGTDTVGNVIGSGGLWEDD